MTQGFPKHIRELAQRCAGRVNEVDVFNHPEGDTLFTDAAGKTHAITLHTKNVLCIEEAFNEVMAASWASIIGAPLAPVMFDYRKSDDKLRRDKNGYGSFITSVQVHKHALRAETVLEYAQAREKGKPYKIHSYDGTMWRSLAHEEEIPPLLDMERAIFHHAITPISEAVTIMEWLGSGDLNPSNQMMDIRKVLQMIRDDTFNPYNNLGFYICDFANGVMDVEDVRKGIPSHIDPCMPSYALISVVETYPSLKAAERKLVRITGKKDWSDINEDYPETLLSHVFAPHLDFKAMHKIMAHIGALDDATIRAEMTRLADTMAKVITDEDVVGRLKAYARYMADALILRRDILPQILESQLVHEEAPHARTNNPFEVFQDLVGEEAARLREEKRMKNIPKAKRPKPAQKPKPKQGRRNET
ncbi:MAG: hypothetical protein SFW65_08230 [Alphaproteobacteria bacterium]|nr:hypothetical protein [Alphaproteobacteria bacterium]